MIPANPRSQPAQRQLDALLKNTSVSIFMMDAQYRCVYMNPAAEQLSGYTLPEMQGRLLHDVVHHTRPDGTPFPMEECPIGCTLEHHDHARGEEVFVHKDGSFYPVAFRAAPLHGDDGEVIGTILEVRDITLERLARQKAAEDKERLHQLLLQVPGMVGVVSGPEHVFEMVNGPMQELYGRTLVGRAVRDALPELVAQGFAELLDQVYASGQPYQGKAVPAMLPTRDGGMELRYFDFVYQPLRDAQGRVTGIFSQGLDVTDAALAHQRLQESERQFRLMADVVPQIIWICDNEGRAEFFNRRWHEYTGQPHLATASDVAGAFVHPDDAAETMERFAHAQKTGTPFVVEHRIRAADGSYRWFLVRAEPLRDETGAILRWFGSSTDISRLKDAEHALQTADRRKDEFLATLAHELRNPLAPVSNAIAILRSPHSREDTRTRMLTLMERQTRHLVRLVDDLLEVSRITRGMIDLRRERLDLRSIAHASVESTTASMDEGLHEVRLHVPPEPVWIQGDPARLKQVLDNLLNNAVKYTPAGGLIEIAIEQAQGSASILVKDNGEGIPPEMLETVFELFAQVDHTLKRAKGGLGIGLALVKELVKLHDGQVVASSAGIGAGSQFTVRLPLAQARIAGADTPLDEQLRPAQRPRRVLIVDDNRDAADTLAEALRLCGHTVHAEYDGRSGIAAAGRLRPDCILLDVGMPAMDGHAVARQLRSDSTHDRCHIVAVTGWGQAADRLKTRQSGFDAHLVKPASVDAVLNLLEELDG
jgi:PAS domain S-box-containing protein